MPDLCVAGRLAAGGQRRPIVFSLLVFLLPVLLAACAMPPRPVPAPPVVVAESPAPAAVVQPDPPPVPAPVVVPAAPTDTNAMMLGYADRVRSLPAAELAQEIARLGDPGDSASRQLQLAIALAASRSPAHLPKAQALLQRTLAQNQTESQALHPLARLLAAQLGEQRRAEEQIERQGQQLRDGQRRIDQLSERLEAVRAIERSLRPAPVAAPPAASAAPANGQRP